MDTTTTTSTPEPDLKTLAGRVIAGGGGGLDDSILRLVQQHEQKKRTIETDPRYTKAFRDEQISALDGELEAALYAAKDADLAAARKDAEQRKAKIVSQLRSQFAHQAPSPAETSLEQAERHARAQRESLALLPVIAAAQAMSDPEDLADLLLEQIHAQDDRRIRTLAPIIVKRLAELAEEEVDGAQGALFLARDQFSGYKKKNPSLPAQLRAAEEDLRNVAAPIERQFQRTLEYFRIGRGRHGITL